MRPTASSAAARAVGGNDENVVGRNTGDAAGERSLGRFLLYVLRHFRRIQVVQYEVSMMRTNLLAGIAVLLLLLLLLAGAALASDCATYCGTFAGYRWCNTRCR